MYVDVRGRGIKLGGHDDGRESERIIFEVTLCPRTSCMLANVSPKVLPSPEPYISRRVIRRAQMLEYLSFLREKPMPSSSYWFTVIRCVVELICLSYVVA
jgi:hypothetical protein